MSFYSATAQRLVIGLVAAATMAGAASAARVSISVTNHSAPDGLYLTPLVSFFHNGSYDGFDAGSAASAGIEALAEDGNPAIELANNPGATTGVVLAPGGFGGAPVLDPGETASLKLKVDPNSARYFSFLSMVIPSNDSFIGNDSPMAYEVFDAMGQFTRIGTINVFGSDVWDAGTEVNDNLGAAFNPDGGTSTDEGGVVALQSDLNFLLGQNRAAGGTVASVQGANDLIASITIAAVPVPAAMPLLLGAFGALSLLRRRRKA